MGAWKRGQGEEKEVRRGEGEDPGRKEKHKAGPERRQPDFPESQSRGFGVANRTDSLSSSSTLTHHPTHWDPPFLLPEKPHPPAPIRHNPPPLVRAR